MSINKLISIRTPIVNAQESLGLDHDKNIPFFTRLATEAEKEIGSFYQYERTKKVLDIKNCAAYLPEDCVLVEVALMGDHGDNCDNLLQQWCGGITNDVTNVNSNGLFLVVDVSGFDDGSPIFGYVNYSYQNNKLIFDRGMCGDKITIQYLKLKTDCDGFMEIGENHVNAIKWYIMWHYTIRQRNKNYIDRDMLSLYEREWNRECAHARAQDAELTQPERENMVRNWHNPYSGRGMWQNLYTTLGTNFNIW